MPTLFNRLYAVVCGWRFGARVRRRCSQHQHRDEFLGELSREPEEMEYGGSDYG